MATKAKEAAAETKYSKQQFISSKKYAGLRYALEAILEDGKTYTITEVDTLLDRFMKGKVK
ncbi:MAG: hypothetical protein IJW86_07330 [Clostridia bacterium]|nr:hypothetical protein [Clostridia bacterium]